MTLDEFEIQLVTACDESPIVVSVSIKATGITWSRVRAILNNGDFLEAFFNEVTGKTSYALIEGNRRVFGADNTGDWHWHPFEKPESHLLTEAPVSYRDFLNRVEEHFKGII